MYTNAGTSAYLSVANEDVDTGHEHTRVSVRRVHDRGSDAGGVGWAPDTVPGRIMTASATALHHHTISSGLAASRLVAPRIAAPQPRPIKILAAVGVNPGVKRDFVYRM